MPRPNRNRTIEAEATLRRNIIAERERRGWTHQTLADAMTKVGCHTNQSAIWKIEKADPPRRITVNELAALSQLWAIPMDRLTGGDLR